MIWRKNKNSSELLNDHVIQPEQESESDEDELAYELHEWAGEARLLLGQLLVERRIAHVWQGATLVVRASDESEVDQAVEDAETVGNSTLSPDTEKVVYEMESWGADQQTVFSELLAKLDVAHEFDDVGDLVVEATDEEEVETALDAFNLMFDDRPELEGLDANVLLSQIFVACDRLRRNPNDDIGVGEIVRLLPLLVGHRPPFGFVSEFWDQLGKLADGLVSYLVEGNTDEQVIVERARELTEKLRNLV